jgi:hypothetical protein
MTFPVKPRRTPLDWLKIIGSWLGWLLALLQFLLGNPPPPGP